MPDLAAGRSEPSAGPLDWWRRPSPPRAAAAWSELAHHPTTPPQAFDPATLDELPPPARRLLDRALPRHTPLGTAVHLGLEGRIRVDGHWFPLAGEEILRAGVGYVWRPVVGGRLVRLTGSEVLSPECSRTDLRLHGLGPVIRRRGEPTGRGSAERLACETVAWLPQALTPQAGARWHEGDGQHAVVTLPAAGCRVDVRVSVDGDGRLRSMALHRHHGPGATSGSEPVGGVVQCEFVTEQGITIAGGGTAGWWGIGGRGTGGREPGRQEAGGLDPGWLVDYAVTSARAPSGV